MRAYPVFLLLSVVGSFAGTASYVLNLVYQVQVVGLNPFQVVVVGTVMEVVCFTAQIPTGVIADLYSRKLSVALGYLLMGIGLLVMVVVPSLTAVLLGHAIWGVGAVCIDGAVEAWAADEIGEARVGRAFARASQAGQVGSVFGVLAAVALASLSLATPILVSGIITIGLAVFLMMAMPERNFVRPAVSAQQRRSWIGRQLVAMRIQVVTGGRAVNRSRVLRCLLAAGLFAGLSSEGIDRLSQPHFLADLHFPGSWTPQVWFGGFSIVAMLGTIALTEVIRRRIDYLDARGMGRALAWITTGSVAAVLVFAQVDAFWPAVAAFLLLGLLRSAAEPLRSAWMVRATGSASRATVFSLQSQVDAAGQIAGGPPIGLIGQRISIEAALTACGFLMAPMVIGYLVAGRGSGTQTAVDVSA